MPKKLIKRFIPSHEHIKRQKALSVFGSLLHNPNLWCLNRRSASGAFAVGLFMTFVPLPSQMIMAAGLAIAFGVNLPLSVTLVWISNPITMPIMFYLAYKVGAWLLNTPRHEFYFELSWSYLAEQMSILGPPFLLGCLVCGLLFALFGYFSIQWLWRYSVVRSWNKRRIRRLSLKIPADKLKKVLPGSRKPAENDAKPD
ncbi:DUF2062 domain-containing protein [Thaumasiovibrio subtropicus]|uniref:DUF2062 domain-containing protein n=1 Tax=Thaumasiovibrio subtropicus TaxID=1891207 RepID=UPI000B35AE97|nr:DUF2062 domain-containing protein [Thaumasiovibrio subtropicus]